MNISEYAFYGDDSSLMNMQAGTDATNLFLGTEKKTNKMDSL